MEVCQTFFEKAREISLQHNTYQLKFWLEEKQHNFMKYWDFSSAFQESSEYGYNALART